MTCRLVNTSVADSIKYSSAELKGEFASLKTTMKQQISTLSEKETRHYTEFKIKVQSDLTNLSDKLNTFGKIKVDIEANNQKIQNKLDAFETKPDEYQNAQNDRITEIETTELTHHKMVIYRVTNFEKSQRVF